MGLAGPIVEVVGVARTAKYLSLSEIPQPYFYLPFGQSPRSRMTLLVEPEGEPAAMSGPLFQLVRSLDPNQPVFNVRPLRAYHEGGVRGPPLAALQMVGATALVGVGLALVGLYGLVAYSVSRRTREIGIRVAVGANRTQVLLLVLRHGFAMSVPVFRLLSAQLAGVGALSPWTMAVVPIGLMVVTLCACYIPGRRASRIDATRALRHE